MVSARQLNIRVYKEYYSTFAEDYEKRTHERAKIIARTMASWIDLKDIKILDLGVGTGSVWEELYAQGVNNIYVVGLDVAPGALRIAKQKNIPWLELCDQKAEDAHYSEHFDIVCAHGLLRHCENPRIVVKRAHTALKDNGQFFFEDMSLEDDVLRIIAKFTTEVKNYLKPSKRKTSFHLTDKELLHLMENVDFDLEEHERFVYAERYKSMKQIKKFLTEKTMFGLYTYKNIPLEHREECDKIICRILRKYLKQPMLQRHMFISLLRKYR
jgi:2-polyprenyl-3-methyl-5-hydroxy-6-metoxy-1,4-benzoquinol methylase